MDITTEAVYNFTTVLVAVTLFSTAAALGAWMITMAVYEIILEKHDRKLREEHFQSLRRVFLNQMKDSSHD
jgi:hypothetical protein